MTQSMIAHTTYSKTEQIKIYMLAARTLNTEIMAMRSIIIITNVDIAWCMSVFCLPGIYFTIINVQSHRSKDLCKFC